MIGEAPAAGFELIGTRKRKASLRSRAIFTAKPRAGVFREPAIHHLFRKFWTQTRIFPAATLPLSGKNSWPTGETSRFPRTMIEPTGTSRTSAISVTHLTLIFYNVCPCPDGSAFPGDWASG